MTQNTPPHHRLNLSLSAKIGSSFDLNLIPDVLSQLLADSRSENTRLAYEKDVVLFFKWATGNKPTSDIVLEFLHLEKSDAVTLEASHEGRPNDAPLFIALDFCNFGHRLTGESIRRTVVGACIAAGINKQMSPHRIRHSAITAALDATDGNVRKVQKLSRHANLETLMVYDDNREKAQLEITELLDDLI
jgi:hypothetical protein